MTLIIFLLAILGIKYIMMSVKFTNAVLGFIIKAALILVVGWCILCTALMHMVLA